MMAGKNLFRKGLFALGLALCTTGMGQQAAAQSGPAFTCSGDIYQVQSGQLRIFDPVTSTYQNVGPKNGSYNATGYNVSDNFAYASQGSWVIRIYADGTIEQVHNVGFGSYSGDVDFSNNYWLRRNHNRYAKIDLATGNFVEVDFAGPGGGPADVAYDQFGGKEYLIGFSGGGTLYRYNITDGTKENISLPGLPSGGYGATWTDLNGRLFTFNNTTGLLFEVFDYFTDSPSFTQVGVGVPSGNNDGFSCSQSPFPNLPPLAQDDDFTTPVGTAISGNVIVDNGNGVDFDPDGGPIVATVDPANLPSDGTVALLPDGSFTYTPDPYFIGTDTFEYTVTDNTGLTATATVTIVVEGDIGYTLDKRLVSGPNPATAEGQVLTYEIEVENTGDIPHTGVSVTDTLPDGSAASLGAPVESGNTNGDAQIGRLDVGESWVYTVTYTVSQDDIDDGGNLVNNVSADTDQDAPQTDSVTTGVAQDPRFTIAKGVNTPALSAPGLLTYTVTVTNTGNQSLTGTSFADSLVQGGSGLTLTSGPTLSGDAGTAGVLDVGEVWTYSATFAATQEEIDDGANIVNTATFDTAQTAAQSDAATTSITQTPGVDVNKTVDIANTDEAELLTYTVVVTNTGNVSLTNPSASDVIAQSGSNFAPSAGPIVTANGNGDGDIDVGEAWTYQVTYSVSQDNLDDGGDLVNTFTFTSDQAGDSDPATTTLTQNPDIAMAKAVADGEPSTFAAVGDTIDFTFTVSNPGNVTLTGPITINDNQIGNGLACLAGPLAPGATATCDITWTADQDDLDAGTVTNVATALSNGEESDPQSATVTALQDIELSLVKEIVAPVPSILQAGEILNYEYKVTNTGNVRIDGPITIADNLVDSVVPPTPISCPVVTSLEPIGLGPESAANTVTCSVAYEMTTNDEELGTVVNVASAEGSFDGNPVVSDKADAIFPLLADPSLAMTKSVVAPAGFSEVGDTITYSFTIENDGLAALPREIFINDPALGGPISCYDPAVEGGSFTVGATHTCHSPPATNAADFIYTVDQDDLDAGEVVNEAVAETTYGTGANLTPVSSPPSMVTVEGTETPGLTVVKTVVAGSPDPAGEGDTVEYQITAENTGNQTLTNVVISDPLLGALTCDLAAPVTLLRTEVLTCTGEYTVMQSDIDDQLLSENPPVLTNEAEAKGTNPQGVEATGEDSIDHELEDAAPDLTVTKAVTPDPGTSPAFLADGDVVTFVVTVANTGNVTLDGIEVTDDLAPGVTCDVTGPLLPGEDDATCIFTYTVDQDDVDIGYVDNTATATAQPANPDADPLEEDGVVRAEGPTPVTGLEVIKSATLDLGADGVVSPGDQISYVITVENTGNVSVLDTAVTDASADAGSVTYAAADDADGDGDIDSMAPGDIRTVTAIHTLTQVEIDSGSFTNSASALGTAPGGGTVGDTSDSGNPVDGSGPDDPTVTPLERTPELTMVKSADPASGVGEGDTVTYTYSVTNTGNTTVTGISVADTHTNADGPAPLPVSGEVLSLDAGAASGDSSDGGVDGTWDSLAPGDTVEFTATYAVTQADVDAGADLTNSATVSGAGPPGTVNPSDTDTEAVPVEEADPSLDVTKELTGSTGLDAGDTLTFTITVVNDGNVSLSNVTTVDTPRNNDGTLITDVTGPTLTGGDAAPLGVLDVDEEWTYEFTLTLTQDDVDSGGISNTVLARGVSPNDGPVTDRSDDGDDADGNTEDDPTLVVIPPRPELDVLKVITSNTIAVNEAVTFEITVENTGNVTLTSVGLPVEDLRRADGTPLTLTSGPTFVGADGGSGPGTLEVGETATYLASYTLTQEDVDAGGISNQATASGTPPSGAPVTDVSDDDAGGDEEDPTVLVIPADPSFNMVKSLPLGGALAYSAVGDRIDYLFTIENTGNVTLTDAFTITDPLITGDGQTITCEDPPLAPGDTLECTGFYTVDQDDLDAGSVENSATADDGSGPTEPSEVTVPALQEPALEMVKTAPEVQPWEYFTGAEFTYTYTMTNSGNVTLTTPIVVTDNLIPASDISCPAFPSGGLAPGGVYTCTGDYTVTRNDVFLGATTNVAYATSGDTTSPQDSQTIPTGAEPVLTLTKEAEDGASFAAVDDEITYTFTVENTGNAAFAAPITITDTKIGTFTCWEPSDDDNDLRAGEVISCEATYAVTQEDLDAGEVVNEAVAETIFSGSTPVSSPPDDVTVAGDLSPELTVTKSAATLPITAVDQVLTYTISVENTGNQTVSGIMISDPLIPALSCGIDELEVGDTDSSCSGTYQVQQSDIDAGELVNTAAATGVSPQGEPVSDEGSLTLDTPAAEPGLTIGKSGSPDPFGPLGSTVTYLFTVANTGNVTLSNVEVSDPLIDGYSCVIDSLAPGVTDQTCVGTYTVTQENVDNAIIRNTASVAGTDPFGNTPGGTGSAVTNGPERMPALEVTKTANLSGQSVGDVVIFAVTVENTGTVTLDNPLFNDTTERLDGSPVFLDNPFDFGSGDTDGDGRLDVGETWNYVAEYTLTQEDLDAGGIRNSVEVTATDPVGTPATDRSDDGDDTDGNSADDPTVVEIIPGPAINAEKTAEFTLPAAEGDTVAFTILVRNAGTVSLSDIGIVDTITRADGALAQGAVTGPTFVSGDSDGDGELDVGEVWEYELTYALTQEDIDLGGIENTATASGASVTDGTVVSDVSDDGDDLDGEVGNDPTVITIPPQPEMVVTKAASTPVALFPTVYEVLFTVTVTNDGNVTQNNVSLLDDLTGFVSPAVLLDTDYPPEVTVSGFTNGAANAAYNGTSVTETLAPGASLPPGAVGTVTIKVVFSSATGFPTGVNTAVGNSDELSTPSEGTVPVTVADSDGDGIPDSDESFTEDRDGDGIVDALDYDPTGYFYCEENGQILSGGSITVSGNGFTQTGVGTSGPITIVRDGATGEFQFFVTAAGTYTLTPTYPPGGTPSEDRVPESGTIDVTSLGGNPAVLGGHESADTGFLNDYTEGTNLPSYLVFDIEPGDPTIISNNLALMGCSEAPDILVTKTADRDSAVFGETINYTLTFRNNLSNDREVRLVDLLPEGLLYTPETAVLDGVVSEPDVMGRRLTWGPLTLAASQTITLTLSVRVVSDGFYGGLTNEAWVEDGAGNIISNVATATVEIKPEGVFDCADIIGKVFDDRNFNGYQDGPEGAPLIDRDAPLDGKGKLAPAPVVPEGYSEPGIPNVRLATVNGLIITTDEYGRFNVPCAALPDSAGENFTLKLDTRSLPTGYRVTTENPRVIRVTAGKLAKLNFGAAIGRVVDIDLMAGAFVPGSATPTSALASGVDQLVGALKDEPSVLRLSYIRGEETPAEARARLDAVEKLVRERWKTVGRYKLNIERTVKRVQ
ncbi:DUF11 domain-containing protein [Alphaproteobacteria bacterium KMM 3653]|uniref:DUF11 domain-containing protein n=1 Tax=Harenicola maris TaxID=2841044 RepID=A0AAP2CRB6_9RHOB|nr:DUF11 domain-containing protein [Harenicola maris]